MLDLTRKSRMALVSLALAAALGASGIAAAADGAKRELVGNQVVVNYADLNLDNMAGNKALYARLSRAAERVCGPEPQLQDLRAHSRYRQCHDDALEKAVDRIGTPELQALHAKQSA
jgi:UrcA family protein